jgi:hypothetical protein
MRDSILTLMLPNRNSEQTGNIKQTKLANKHTTKVKGKISRDVDKKDERKKSKNEKPKTVEKSGKQIQAKYNYFPFPPTPDFPVMPHTREQPVSDMHAQFPLLNFF